MVEKLEYWQIATLLGTVVFLVSAFMPLISIQALGASMSINLIDAYSAFAKGEGEIMQIGVGFLLTLVLYPITVIFGFVSLVTRKVALAAGILGIVCWIGSLWAISALKSWMVQQSPFGELAAGMIQYGVGIFMGIIGAIILLVAYFLRRRESPIETATRQFDQTF